MKIRRLVLTVLAILIILPGSILAEAVAQMPDVMKPTFMAIDDENIYIVDGATIWIYSMDGYKLKGKFGKKGEGPQEFMVSPGGQGGMVFPQKDSLVVNSQGKVSYWTKDGKFIREMKAPPGMTQGAPMVQPVGKNYVGLSAHIDQKNAAFSAAVTLYDANMNKIKVLHTIPFMKNSKMQFPITIPFIYVHSDKIVGTGGDKFSFNMSIYDDIGNLTTEITREYKPLKVHAGYKDEVYEMYKKNPDTKNYFDLVKQVIEFGHRFPPIQGFFLADNTIYIQTYKKENGKYEFFIYSIDGKFIKQVYLPVDYMWGILPYPMAVKNNTLFQLLENEDEEVWELHATKIE